MCLAASLYFESYQEEFKHLSPYAMVIWYLLILEHVYNWITTLFRNWEVDQKGVLNEHGLKRAPIESTLRSFQIYFDCLLCGCIIFYMITHEE